MVPVEVPPSPNPPIASAPAGNFPVHPNARRRRTRRWDPKIYQQLYCTQYESTMVRGMGRHPL
jgi:hypothetical protein